MTTKIHLVVDALGRPLKLILTLTQRGDAPLAPALLDGLSPRQVPADKVNDSNALWEFIATKGAEAVIPCNPTTKQAIPYDFEAYKIRNTVERCFNKLKHSRCTSTRFGWHATYFLEFLQIAAAMIWMRLMSIQPKALS